MLWRGLLRKRLRTGPQHNNPSHLLLIEAYSLFAHGKEAGLSSSDSSCAGPWPFDAHHHHELATRPYSTDGQAAAAVQIQQQQNPDGVGNRGSSRVQQAAQPALKQPGNLQRQPPSQRGNAPSGNQQQRPGFLALRSMQGSGGAAPPMTDLARENAPTKVLELIGDPRSGVADDVARNPFGGLTVELLHHQPTNEVFWYKYELYGNQMKEGHRDARLSEYSKNLMYLLRAKDPSRWSLDALSKKFRVRKQRVMAILALKEMEGHELERTLDQGGPLSAYACRVRMSDVHLDPATGEPLELGSNEMRRLEIDSARAAVAPPPPKSVLKSDRPGGAHSAADAAADADPAVLPLHNALPRMAVMAHQVQLELLGALRPVSFDLGRVRAEVQAGLDGAEARLRAALPASCFAAALQGEERGGVEGAEEHQGSEQGAAQPQDSQQQQQHARVAAAVTALQAHKQHALEALEALEAVLLEAGEGGASGPRPFRSPSLQLEQRAAAAAAALPQALSAAARAPGAPGGGGGSSDSSGSPGVGEALAGLKGPELLRVVQGLPPAVRSDLLRAHPPTRAALNQMGVDLTALTSSSSSSSSSSSDSRVVAKPPAEPAKQGPSAGSAPFPDVLGYTHIPPTQYARLQQALQALGASAAAATAAVHAATAAAAPTPSPLHAAPTASSASPPTSPASTSELEQQQQQLQLPAQVVAAAARMSGSYKALAGACQHLRLGGKQQPEGSMRMSTEEIAQRLTVLAEVDPQLVEAAYDVEAVQQIRALGTRSTEQKEGQLWWDALQRYKATHGDAFGSKGSSSSSKRASDVMKEGGSGPARHSWEAIAAWLDVFPGGKVYHRGSGERQLARLATYPAFEGLPLSAIDALQESELSVATRAAAQQQEAQLWQDFRVDLLFNLGLRGDGLRDASTPPPTPNLTSSLEDAPIVVYDITRDGQTVHPPLFVLDRNGQRPLNEQEQIFQERRLRDVQADQFPWSRPHYTTRRTKYKPELQ